MVDLAFTDCAEALNRALESPNGIEIEFNSPGAAVRFRARCNMYRQRDRKANAETYPKDHPLYHTSIFDQLTILHKPGSTLLIFEPISASIKSVRERE